MKTIAIRFGRSLDADDFAAARALLASNCTYVIGEQSLVGPEAICASYETNMLEGRQKLDGLEWGESRVEECGEGQYFVHFTDFLTHKGQCYTHRCKQKLTIVADARIVRIEHIDDPEEQAALDAFYRRVGLK